MSDYITEPQKGVTSYAEITWKFNQVQVESFLDKHNIRNYEFTDNGLYITDNRFINASGYVEPGTRIVIIKELGFAVLLE